MTPAGSHRRFLFWFARQNLFAPATARSTQVNRQTVALVTFFSLTSLGLALGVWRVRVERQMRDRLNLCLFIGSPNETARIDAEMVRKIRSDVPKVLHEPDKFLCFPFSEVKYLWYEEASPGQSRGDNTPEYFGRTIATGDPLLQSREIIEGPGAANPNFQGVAISTIMRRLLKIPRPLPPTLRLRHPITSLPLEVPLAGVLKPGELPFGHDFVIPESVEDTYINTEPDIPSRIVDTGPVPDDWPTPGGSTPMPKDFDRALNRLRLAIPKENPPAKPGGKRTWRLTSKVRPEPTRLQWQASVGSLLATMKAAGLNSPDSFLKIRIPDAAAPDRRTLYQMAALYVGDDPDLQPAATAVRALQFKANESIIESLAAIGRTSRGALTILGAVAAVFLINGWSNMYVIQRLRSERMRSEIGMLKAIGMDGQSLLKIVLVEALILWVGGTIRGIALGLILGYACAWAFIAERPSEIWTAFACPWWLCLLLLSTTFTTFLASSVLASRESRLAPPIETLRGS